MTRTNERSAAQLLSSFGAPPPSKPRTTDQHTAPKEKVNRPIAPRRGLARSGQGWAPVEAPLAVY